MGAAHSAAWPFAWKARTDVDVLIICDPGPDPSDAKAILIAGILHQHGVINVKGVVTNGGGQARGRAKLARALLNHIGAKGIPVGIGTAGRAAPPRRYEYNLDGFESVDEGTLHGGASLIDTVLRRGRDQSLRLVLLSSLRDAVDAILRAPDLFQRKVHTVAIMGGIQPSAHVMGGAAAWEPDASANNTMDMEAARTVYRFCLQHGVPMAVLGRKATPPIPIRLARSFADRTKCPVLSYIATAQVEGLRALWQKLCAGQLPDHCTKEWYFEVRLARPLPDPLLVW